MSFRLIALLGFAVAVSGGVAAAQSCNLNPSGPDQITLLASSAGSDFDIGWKGAYHDYQVPDGGLFQACLEDCDGASDTDCVVNGYASGQNAGGRAFLPPIPIAIGSVAVCAVTTFEEPFATGTADVATGDLDVTAQFSAKVYNIQIGGGTFTNVCPKCSGSGVGDTGTCSGGANNGGACTTSSVITVQNTSDGPYTLSRDCLPSGGAASTAFSVHFTNGTATINGACGATSNDCGAGTCQVGVCNAGTNGGNRQACCSNNHNKSCFTDPLTRTGVANVPSPSLPDTTYPKTSSGTVVGTFCAPATGNILVDPAVGLAGPGAFVLPVDVTWDLDPTATSTTTTTVVTTTTTTSTIPPCTADAQCSDGDPCTQDVCNTGTGACSNPPATGAAAVSCQVGDVDPATVCGADPVDAALQTSIATQLLKAKGLLDQIAAAPPKKQKKLRNQAKAALKPIVKKAAKAAKKKTITTACRDSIKTLVQQLQAAIAAL